MPKPRENRAVRRHYDLKPVRIRLKRSWLLVNDVGNDGIGVVLERDGPSFSVGERIDAIPIPLEEGEAYLNGVVSHVSETARKRICGIRFLFTGNDYDIALRFKRQVVLNSRGVPVRRTARRGG